MTRRRSWTALGAATTILVLASGFILLRGGSTPVPVGTAVERFRGRPSTRVEAESATPTPGRARDSGRKVSVPVQVDVADEGTSPPGLRPRPAEGVYVYATKGGDEVDVLGGSRHTYPPETTVTIRHAGCGLVERWDALEERWDERESCRTPEGDTLKRMTSFHEFFGHADQRTLHCKGFTYPAGFQPGQSWSAHCASENTTAVTKLSAVGWEDVDVAGVRVRTMHVRASTRLTGEQEGTSERDVWGSAETGLVVRERSNLTSYSNQPVFGRTRYHEEYEIQLKSPEPRR